MLYFLSLSLMIFVNNLWGASPPHLLTFHELMAFEIFNPENLSKELISLHNTEVEVRGFLYKTAKEDWILAAQPNLKSCCVGSSEKINQQIFLEGDPGMEASTKPVLLQGRFLINPVYGPDGNLQKLYHLSQPQMAK
jgi:hypothetical protein